MDTKTLDHNAIAATAAANRGITNTTGFYDDSNAPTPTFTIKPTPETEPYNEHEESEDDDEDNYDDDGAVEEV